MRNYLKMVKMAPVKNESIMWNSIEHISRLLDQLEGIVPDMVRDFLIHEHVQMYGPHFDEASARDEVDKMHHYAADGSHIVGEVITPDEAASIVQDGTNGESYWDAYVGANGIAHDLARSVQDKSQILSIAKDFWYHDDDFDDGEVGKIWWYYTNKR